MPSDSRPSAPEECAICGAPIPRHARACPACGADERTGWREQSLYDGLDLPDEAWADDEPADARPVRRTIPWYWLAAAILVLLALALAILGLR